MHVRKLNKAIFGFDKSHPARLFLEAFIKCRKTCVGLHLLDPSLEQQYVFDDGKLRSFGGLMYLYISFDIVLDGWLNKSPDLTENEKADLEGIPHIRSLLQACRAQAECDGNFKIIPYVDQVAEMLNLWEACIRSRQVQITSNC